MAHKDSDRDMQMTPVGTTVLRLFGIGQPGETDGGSDRDPLGNQTIPFLSGDELMAQRNRQVLLRRIEALAGLPDVHFDKLYRSMVLRFAAFVQLLPASEAHHHARLGGLLDHSLDVAHRALALRRGHLLPPQSPPEVVGRLADVWSFGVFSAALLHDVGKAVVNQHVTQYDGRGALLGPWNPWVGPMTGIDRYHVEFRHDRAYEDHTTVAPFVARTILPDAAVAWLGADVNLMLCWMATLAGNYDRGGVLGSVVMQADALSTAADTGAGDSSRLASARRVPLHEKLLSALRQLLESGDLPLNRKGAAAWSSTTDVWFVSKRTIDALRSHLLDQGHTDIPSRNDRIMDALQQHAICIANQDRAIWRTRIRFDDFDQVFTMLRVSVETLWPNPAQRPEPLDGNITLEDGSEPTPASSTDEGSDTTEAPSAPTPTPVAPAADQTPLAEPEVQDELQARPPPDETSRPHTEDDGPAEPAAFIEWLRSGVVDGVLEVNTPEAVLHGVEEGLLIISPRVFKKYAGTTGSWEQVQRRFLRRRFHRRNTDNTNIFRYEVRGKRRTSILKGVLVSDPEERLGIAQPRANPHLKRVTEFSS